MRPPARDACPGLLALHPARDGGVARIRLPGGYVTGPRWRALARLARDLGDGHLDLTSRGNVQLRGIADEAADELARRAAAAGLLPSVAHDRARNIMASPLAGLGGRPPLRQLVRRLDDVLLADPALAALPGRFLFSLDDGTGGSGLAGCDIGLRRVGEGAEVIVAGRRTGVRVRVIEAVAAVAAGARAAVSAGVGSTVSRVADLDDGGAAVAAAIGGRLGVPAGGPDARLALGVAARHHLGPAGGPDAGLAPGGAAREDSRRAARAPGELVTVVLAAPLGRLTSRQIELTADALAGREAIRIGIAGRLVLPLDLAAPEQPAAAAPASPQLGPALASPALAGPPPAGRAAPDLSHSRGPRPTGAGTIRPAAGLDAVLAQLAGAGLIMSAGHELAEVTACSGAACSRSLADVRAVAGPVPGHPRPHWSGCGRTCGLPPDAEPVIAADSRRYLVPGASEPVPCEMLVAP